MDKEVRATTSQTFFNATCTPNEKGGQRIRRNTDGALLLINNYLLTYRCQRDRAAEGRQFFEVPGFLATAGGATAAALGAGPHVAIATGATSAVLGQGKSYYAPKDKAVVFNDGLDALMCIQNQAVGIDPYTLKTLSKAQEAGSTPDPQPEPQVEGVETTNAKNDKDPPEPYVTVSSERQYFDMIRTALFAVESVVAQRLSNAGTPFDADGVIAEIEKLGQQEKDEKAEAGADDPATAGKDAKDAVTAPDTSGQVQTEGVNLLKAKFKSNKDKLEALSNEQVDRTVIKLYTLQTKLDQCIVRAKI